MFGRHLKDEYKTKFYCLIDKDTKELVGTRRMNMENPVIAMSSMVFIPVFITMLILYCTLPFFNLIIPETICHMIIWIVGVSCAFIGYHCITEEDEE